MSFSSSWSALIAQALLRGAGWLLLLLLTAPLAKRLSAARRALGWQMAFVGLILLPILLVALPPLALLPSEQARPTRVAPSPLPTPAPAPQEPSSSQGTRLSIVVPRGSRHSALSLVAPSSVPSPSIPTAVTSAAVASGGRPIRLTTVLAFAWGFGVVWFLMRLGVNLLALRRLGRHTGEISAGIAEEASACAERLGISRPVVVRLAAPESGLHAPITWGVRRPVILLPAEYATETPTRCRAALLHEMTHIRRHDWSWMLLAQSLCALYWCVPFAWMAARRLGHETELACDDCVLSAGISAADYAAQILEVVRKMQTQNTHLPLSALPMARLPLAETRIRAILDPSRRRQSASRSLLVLAALLPALGIPILSLRAIAAPEAHPRQSIRTPALSAMPAPSSSEMTTMPAEPAPMTIRKSVSKPTVPAGRSGASASALPDLSVATLQPMPTAPRSVRADPPAQEAPAIVWGPVVNGLQAGLRLVSPKAGFAPGEPIWQETYLRNTSKAAVTVQSISGYDEQGAPRVIDKKGALVKVLRCFGMGFIVTLVTRVDPGEIAQVGRVAVAFRKPERGADRPNEVAPGISFSAEGMPLALTGPGAYTLAQELLPLDVDGKSLNLTLLTGVLPIRIDNVSAVQTPRVDHNRIADLATAPISWGPEHAGLQAGLYYIGAKSDFFVGERVRVAVILRNVSKASILFWHQTSFAFLDTPQLTDTEGKARPIALLPETEWKTVLSIRMTGVTFDMSSAPSADGPSYLHRSEIAPGQAILGYYVTGFVVPAQWKDGQAVPGRYRMVQPVRLGLGKNELLDTSLETGTLTLTLNDPDGRMAIR